MSQRFTGAGVALITPFNEDFSVDYNSLGQIIENQISGGMDYLVSLGTTGETPALDEQEKNDIIRFTVEKNAGRLPIIAGMGGNSTQAVIQSIQKANLDGVDGLLVVTPYYNRPSQEGLFRHFSAVAENSPLPVILYNVPSRTGVNMEAETVIKLAETHKNIAGIKEASGILSQLSTIRKYAPGNFTLISGDDVLALPIMSIGGEGVISVIANALPKQLSGLIHKAMEGDYAGALQIHFELIDLFKLIFREGNPGGIKALMHAMGISKNIFRLPLYPVSENNYGMIADAYKKLRE